MLAEEANIHALLGNIDLGKIIFNEVTNEVPQKDAKALCSSYIRASYTTMTNHP